MSADAYIAVEGLGRSFPAPDGSTLKVLEEMSFQLSSGALVSLLGPSGCGKSTLLNLLASIDTEASGSLRGGDTRIDGRAIGPEHAPHPIGFVFQESRLLDWRTLRRNIELPLEETALSKEERYARAAHYIGLSGLTGYEDYYPNQISGGMQQRVALARALAVDPTILLMDEPFSGLDALTAQRMREELIRIWQETGKTILFVTHDISEAAFLSQRVLLLTQKPAKIHASVTIGLPYPKEVGDAKLFEKEREIRQKFPC